MSTNIYSWEFNNSKDRGQMWYIIAISLVIGGSLWGILTNQYGFTFLILLIAGIYYFVENNSGDTVKIEILETGIIIDSVFYDYSSVNFYSFVYKDEEPIYLRVSLNKKGIGFIDMNITRDNIGNIRSAFSDYLEEGEKNELKVSEKMIDLLKL